MNTEGQDTKDFAALYEGWFKTPEQIAADFDKSPIREETLLAALGRSGQPLDRLTVSDLAQATLVTPLTYGQSAEGDQDHWGGVQATEALASMAGLREGMRVLDVGCGLGGSARYLAWKYGCHATGLDLTASRIESAKRLTFAVGLQDRVTFDLGNALDLPYAGGSFDVVWGQSAWWLIPKRERFLAEAFRVLAPGGAIAFEDRLLDAHRGEMAEKAYIFNGAWSRERYAAALGQAGFVLEREEDWTPWMLPTLRSAICEWTERVEEQIARLGLHRAMYQVMREAQKLALATERIIRLAAFVARKPLS